MNKQSQSRNKWCKYCGEYQENLYYNKHLQTKKHKANVIRNQIRDEPIEQQIPDYYWENITSIIPQL